MKIIANILKYCRSVKIGSYIINKDFAKIDEYGKSIFEKAISKFRDQNKDIQEDLAFLYAMGIQMSQENKQDLACNFFEHAYALAQETKNEGFELLSLGYLTDLYRGTKSYEEMLNYVEKWILFSKKSQTTDFKIVSFRRIGSIHEEAKQLAKAQQYYELAHNCCLEAKNDQQTSIVLNELASVYQDLENYSEAILSYQKALTFYESSDDLESVENKANTLSNLALAHSRNKDDENAHCCIDAYLSIHKELDNEYEIAEGLSFKALLFEHQKDFTQALQHYQKAHDIYQEENYDHNVTDVLGKIAKVHIRLQNYSEAKKCYETAHSIALSLEDENAREEMLDFLTGVLEEIENSKEDGTN